MERTRKDEICESVHEWYMEREGPIVEMEK